MSGVHPYCVVASGLHPPSRLTGLFGRPVVGHDFDSFTVWSSELEHAPRVDLERVSQHHEVVRVASATTSPLPVRFGAWAPSLEELTRRVRDRRSALEAGLVAVAERAEFGVTIEDSPGATAHDAADTAPNDPRTYLRDVSRVYAARRTRRKERERLTDELRATLGELPVDERAHVPSPPLLVSVAYLIARADERRFRVGVHEFVRKHDCVDRVRITGPWPPYSFAAR